MMSQKALFVAAAIVYVSDAAKYDKVGIPGNYASKVSMLEGLGGDLLGCGDWTPDCPLAAYTEDHDSDDPKYNGPFWSVKLQFNAVMGDDGDDTTEAGGAEWKAAIGGTWDVSYGDGGWNAGDGLCAPADGAGTNYVHRAPSQEDIYHYRFYEETHCLEVVNDKDVFYPPCPSEDDALGAACTPSFVEGKNACDADCKNGWAKVISCNEAAGGAGTKMLVNYRKHPDFGKLIGDCDAQLDAEAEADDGEGEGAASALSVGMGAVALAAAAQLL